MIIIIGCRKIENVWLMLVPELRYNVRESRMGRVHESR